MMFFRKHINVVVVEADVLTRFTLTKMISSIPNVAVCADFDNAEDCLFYMRHNKVDLILMDVSLPYMGGIEASILIRKFYPAVKLALVMVHDSDKQVVNSLFADADGYFIRDFSFEFLKCAIDGILSGKKFIDKRIQNAIFNCVASLNDADKSRFKKFVSLEKQVLIESLLSKRCSNECFELSECKFSEYLHYVFHKLKSFSCFDLLKQEINYEL